jgi:hypothetical protein
MNHTAVAGRKNWILTLHRNAGLPIQEHLVSRPDELDFVAAGRRREPENPADIAR